MRQIFSLVTEQVHFSPSVYPVGSFYLWQASIIICLKCITKLRDKDSTPEDPPPLHSFQSVSLI